MNENKRLIKNTGIIAIGNISTKLISFFLLPLYTALLSTSEYGTFDYILSISIFCIPFVSVLMDEAIFRFLIDCNTEEEKKRVITTATCVVFCGMLLFTIIGIPVMNMLRYSYTYYAVVYILLNVICGMISALLRGIGRTDQYALFNFLLGFIQVLLNVILIAGFKLGLVGMLMASISAQCIVSVIFIFRIKIWRYITFRNASWSKAKEMILYSFPLIPNKISWTIINLSDRIILMNVLGSDATGLYAVSYKFPNLMDTVYGFFYQSWKESSARVLKEENQDDFYNSVYENLKNFMFSLVLGMTAFMPLVFFILINKNYYAALPYIPVLLLATYFSNMSGFYGGIFTAYKDTKIMGTTTVAAAVINLSVNLLMIRKFGIYAAAVSTLVANFVVYVYRKIKVRKYIKLKENWKKSTFAVIFTVVEFAFFYTMNKMLWMAGCALAVFYAFFLNRSIVLFVIKKMKTKILGEKNGNRKTK